MDNISFPSNEPQTADIIATKVAPAEEDASHHHQRLGESFVLGGFSVDEYRPIKIAVIGAGFSGIIAGIRLAQKVPNIDLKIYEKNDGIGGTWYTSRYPGVACDFPSPSYQLSFEANPNWSAYYAPGSEILAYMQRVVDKYKLMKHIRLNHELVHAKYDEPLGKWNIRIRRSVPDSDPEEFEDTADIIFNCTGCLSRWKWPDTPGLDNFKGRLLHTANWDISESPRENPLPKDWSEKRVGVIGAGSSALQIVPALQPKVAHLDTFVRSATWLIPGFSSQVLAKFNADGAYNYVFTDEDKRAFEDPERYNEFRRTVEQQMNSSHQLILKGSPMQIETRKALIEDMTKKLAKKPWIAKHLIPDFPVSCRRPTPDAGYLAALCEDNVDFISSTIKRVTSDGIELSDGEHRMLDVLVCATGYDVSYQYPFPVVGRNGTTLQSKWKPYPKAYLGVCVDEFPNMFFVFGPNSVGTGPLLMVLERQVNYAIDATLKIQRERLKSLEVKKAALDDFDEYLEHYFQKTVFSEKCSSWHKMGKDEGRIIGPWPGTASHAMRALAHPRWEDFDHEYLNSKSKNRFFWLGDGQTFNEKTMGGNRAWYLDDDEIDIPPVPEA